MMRDCAVLAIEGTHASGKTTLTHALAARYRKHGIRVATVEEPARRSPFIEKIVVHGRSRFDLEAVADLFGAQLSAQLHAARQHTMIIWNKTIANVLTYAWLVLPTPARQPSWPRWKPSAAPGPRLRHRLLLLRQLRPETSRRPLPRQSPGPAVCRRRDAVVLASLRRRGLLTPHDACPFRGPGVTTR